MQNPQTPLETDSATQERASEDLRRDTNRIGNDAATSRPDASSGPLLPESTPTPGDPNFHGGRRILGTSLGMFLPAVILLLIGIAIIVYIAW